MFLNVGYFVAFVVHVVTEGWFTMAEIFPGSISTVHKWFDGWTFCILYKFSALIRIVQYVKVSELSAIVIVSRLDTHTHTPF